MNVDTNQFSAKLILHDGETSSLPYERFSKKYSDDVIFAQEENRVIKCLKTQQWIEA